MRTAGQRRWRQRVLIGAMLLIGGFVLFSWKALVARAQMGTAYGARIACSCRFIAHRPFEQCGDDLISGMALVMLSENADEKSVTATVPLLSRTTASLRDAAGCQLEPLGD